MHLRRKWLDAGSSKRVRKALQAPNQKKRIPIKGWMRSKRHPRRIRVQLSNLIWTTKRKKRPFPNPMLFGNRASGHLRFMNSFASSNEYTNSKLFSTSSLASWTVFGYFAGDLAFFELDQLLGVLYNEFVLDVLWSTSSMTRRTFLVFADSTEKCCPEPAIMLHYHTSTYSGRSSHDKCCRGQPAWNIYVAWKTKINDRLG